jgi:hypothetical protein|tara:strand:- start:381 stop:611 length:231 start_codon:yes stop_codon:yes gene_type:complete
MILPFGRRPSWIAMTICVSVQAPMPVSLSGLVFGALAVQVQIFRHGRHTSQFHAGDVAPWTLWRMAIAAGHDGAAN